MNTALQLQKKRILLIVFVIALCNFSYAQNLKENPALDEKVKAFLSENRNSWRDMNVPASDGQILFDIITKNGYKNAVEIGTSTGHSGVWIAWALSKTGGKLITMEIDEDRYKEALANFEAAGVSEYIDARLGDAHDMTEQLEGPIDFVFSDADKEWYTNYFKALAPELVVGGSFVAHNITQTRRQRGITEYVNYIEAQTNFETTYNYAGSGISISKKISD